MLIFILTVLSALLLFLGQGGQITFVCGLFISVCLAAATYNESVRIFWRFKELEKKFEVLRMKRRTILKEILQTIDVWSHWEKDVLEDAGLSSINATFLTERYPQLRTMGEVSAYLDQLTEIENKINQTLSSRLTIAAEWHTLNENIWTGIFSAHKGDIPEDLLGEINDPKIDKEY